MSAWEAAVQSVGTVGCLVLLVALGCRLHWSTRAAGVSRETPEDLASGVTRGNTTTDSLPDDATGRAS